MPSTAKPLPVAGDTPRFRPGRWRVAVLIAVHLLAALHIAHWVSNGETLSPLEPSESMEFSTKGIVNAGLIFFGLTIASTLVFGRWFCGWACHLVALQDASRALLLRLGITPRPLRSRTLIWIPLVAFLYMFVVPFFTRPPVEQITSHLQTTDFWATFPTWPVALVTFVVCGFVAVLFLGSKGFCTYACPYGAIFGLADTLSPMRIRVTDACESCGKCTSTCSSNVIVHAEVRDYGMVVDPGCMKCLDCVAGCPTNALYFGFGKPAILKTRTDKAKGKAAKPAFTWASEALLAGVFAVTFVVFRGAYDVVPFLFALGLSGVLAYGALLASRLLRRPSVKLTRWHLKKGGSLRPAGWAFVAASVAIAALWGHTAVVRAHDYRAADLHQQTGAFQPSKHPWRAQLAQPVLLNAAQREIVESALAHATTVQRLGLLPSPGNHLRLAWLSLLLADDEGAETYVKAALEALPKASAVRADYAVFLIAKGRTDEAIAVYRKAIEIDTKPARAHHSLARLFVQTMNLDAASAEYTTLLALVPHSADLLLEAGSVAAATGSVARAAELFAEATTVAPERVGAWIALVEAEHALAHHPEAIAACQVLLQNNPSDPFAHRLLGLSYMAQGQRDLAKRHLERAWQGEQHKDTRRALNELNPAR